MSAGVALLLVFSCLFAVAFQTPLVTSQIHPVHNIDTGLDYDFIQAAIDAPETQNGDTITVDSGIYVEAVIVSKSLTLIGEDKEDTIIDPPSGSQYSIYVNAHVDNVRISGFTVNGALWACIYFYSANQGCIIENNIIRNPMWSGILMEYNQSDVIIRGNTIQACFNFGIEIWEVSNAILQGNSIIDCDYGIIIGAWWFEWLNGTSVHIFHNNLINSQLGQAFQTIETEGFWDEGPLVGGNYWSDYNGSDTNGDGIGDTPYVLDGGEDNYPLMSSCTSTTQTFTRGGQSYPVLAVSNATVLNIEVKPGTLKTRLSGATGNNGYVTIVQPIGLNRTSIKVIVNNTRLVPPPYPEITSNGTHYFIYFVVTFESYYEIFIVFPVLCDANLDGTVNILDCIQISKSWSTNAGDPTWNPFADFNEDNKLNILDCIMLSNNMGNSWE